jgi:hypothetical protein
VGVYSGRAPPIPPSHPDVTTPSLGRSLRRGAGLALLLLSTVPAHRLLLLGETGLAGRTTTEVVSVQAWLLWSAFLLVLAVGLLAATVVPAGILEARFRRAGRILESQGVVPLAVTAGGIGTALTLLFSWRVTGFRPNLIDGLTQLLHARYLASGTLAANPELWGPHWHVQNSVLTHAGWISHFPPGHVAMLALGFMAGAVWAVGPLLMGVTAFFSVLIGDRLFPDRRALGRLGGLLVALSPFLLVHSGTFMSHATASALGTAGLYFALRAGEGGGHRAWAAAAGLAVAAVFATRPLAGVLFAAIISAAWLVQSSGLGARPWTNALRQLPSRSVWATIGASPILGLVLAYNARFTGSVFRFPYHESFGASVGLGFGRDPWGNQYGPLEALAYTSADLTALNLSLLEAPVPVVVIVGLFLLLRKRLTDGERVLALWACLPVIGNAFFWHHGHFMGPRMLAEFAPGWILLTVAAGAGLSESLPDTPPARRSMSPRTGFLGLVLAALVGMTMLAPQRLQSFGGSWMDSFPEPPPNVEGPSLIFVHGSWDARIFSLLATRGIRLDVLETALRQNPTCLVHLHALALERQGPPFGEARSLAPGRPLSALDLHARDFQHEPEVRLGGGPPVRIVEGEPLAPECEREIRADRLGVLEVTALLWQGDLPGIEEGLPMYVRDLGPERNREILERYPDRRAFLYTRTEAGGIPILVDYEEGIEHLWGDR